MDGRTDNAGKEIPIRSRTSSSLLKKDKNWRRPTQRTNRSGVKPHEAVKPIHTKSAHETKRQLDSTHTPHLRNSLADGQTYEGLEPACTHHENEPVVLRSGTVQPRPDNALGSLGTN